MDFGGGKIWKMGSRFWNPQDTNVPSRFPGLKPWNVSMSLGFFGEPTSCRSCWSCCMISFCHMALSENKAPKLLQFQWMIMASHDLPKQNIAILGLCRICWRTGDWRGRLSDYMYIHKPFLREFILHPTHEKPPQLGRWVFYHSFKFSSRSKIVIWSYGLIHKFGIKTK